MESKNKENNSAEFVSYSYVISKSTFFTTLDFLNEYLNKFANFEKKTTTFFKHNFS